MKIHHLAVAAAVAGALALPATSSAKPVYPPPVCGDTAVECAVYVVNKYLALVGEPQCGGPVCPSLNATRP